MIIVLDGIDGCGKTTLAERLTGALMGRGHRALSLRDPGHTDAGERIRAIVKDKRVPLQPTAQMLLFTAARVQLTEEVIKPALNDGQIVVLSRWWFSTFVYQSVQGVNGDLIIELNKRLTALTLDSALCFWLELSGKTSIERSQVRDGTPQGHDRWDTQGLEFRMQLHDQYRHLRDEGYMTRINAEMDETTVFNETWAHVVPHLPDVKTA